jgi:transcriptional regulator with XRE-family HTH domain
MANPSSFQIRTKKLGVLIRNARLAADRSEEDCARAMGINPAEFSAFEQGDKAPSLPEIEVLAFYLDTPIDYFLGSEDISLDTIEQQAIDKLDSLLALRNRIIGVMLRKARMDAGITLEELARHTEIEEKNLISYEAGAAPVPLPELEVIVIAVNVSLRDFRDQSGPVGRWSIQKKAIEDFSQLPLEMQQFISKPINQPYLELAQRLSEMSVDRLRGVAEGLLEITL